MCRSLAEGGQRCASHTRPAYEAALTDYDHNRGPSGSGVFVAADEVSAATRLADAAAHYASTPEGAVRVSLEADARMNGGDLESGALLNQAVQQGRRMRLAAQDTAAIVRDVTPGSGKKAGWREKATRLWQAARTPADTPHPPAVTTPNSPPRRPPAAAPTVPVAPRPVSAPAAAAPTVGGTPPPTLGDTQHSEVIAAVYERARDPKVMAYGIHEPTHNRVAELHEEYLAQAGTPRSIAAPDGTYTVPYDSRLMARLTSATAYTVCEAADAEARGGMRGGSPSVYRPETIALARKLNTGDPGAPHYFQAMQVSGPDGKPRYFPAISQDAARFMIAVREDQQRSPRLDAAAADHAKRMQGAAAANNRFSL